MKGRDLVPAGLREIFIAIGGCGGCITGIYPIDKNGILYQNGRQNA